MLHIFRPPFSMRTAHDILGDKTALMFSQRGLPCVAKDLWPNRISCLMHKGIIPFGVRGFAKFLAPQFAKKAMRGVKSGDVFWTLGAVVPRHDGPQYEENLKKIGAKYIFHIMDDWLDVPNLREATIRRAVLSDLIVVPTPVLYEKIQRTFPQKNVVRLEEPIDVDRVFPQDTTPLRDAIGNIPVIVWTGNPGNLQLLEQMTDILALLSKKARFRLRVVSDVAPLKGFPFEWEWKKYNYANESAVLAGAVAGLAPLNDLPFDKAKGIYKVKTYMAAGIPPVGSAIGYQTQLVSHGETGFLCSSQSDWIDGLILLLTNNDRRVKMSSNARNAALRTFSHDAVAKEWLSAVARVSS